MKTKHPCPKCGKPMTETPKFPGLWTCPDFATPLNDRPPFRYRCTGSELTTAGADLLEKELARNWLESLRTQN